jgi:hypothetical protein
MLLPYHSGSASELQFAHKLTYGSRQARAKGKMTYANNGFSTSVTVKMLCCAH